MSEFFVYELSWLLLLIVTGFGVKLLFEQEMRIDEHQEELKDLKKRVKALEKC
jgi:hypothetical protein